MSLSENEEDLFDDIYADDEPTTTNATVDADAGAEMKAEAEPVVGAAPGTGETDNSLTEGEKKEESYEDAAKKTEDQEQQGTTVVPPTTSAPNTAQSNQSSLSSSEPAPGSAGSAAVRADLSREGGKMFIGGLDWDTDEDRLKEYFSQYGEVVEHTIMREAATGRSRGFGFLTFADPQSVRDVLKTQHVLDGKVIDPKRSIPKEEQNKTGKIFVGGIPPEVRPHEYEEFFSQFGNIIDAQLMLDKDTGKSRGFGFITFDSSEAVDKVCKGRYLDFHGKQVEVKRAEPRGPQQQQNHIASQQQRYMQHGYGQRGVGGYNNRGAVGGFNAQSASASVPQQQNYYGVTPEAMNDYYQKMTQYWQMLQQQGGQAAQFAQFGQQLQQMQQPQQPQQQPQQQQQPASTSTSQTSPAPPTQPPINAPRGPRGSSRGARGGRGGRNYGDRHHPYQR